MPRKRDYNADPDPGRAYYWCEDSGAAMGWDEIGERLGISGERARQVYRVAMRKLRRNPEAVALFMELCRDK